MLSMHIGFDDTDSPQAGCTTYIAALLVEKLDKLGVSFIDYPNLIRLNPNVPWKTRGNGALCLRIQCNENFKQKIKEIVVEAVEKNADMSCPNTNPGAVLFYERNIPEQIKVFAQKTIKGVVKIGEALKLIKKFNADAVRFKKGRGIIGGLAAIGETLERDHTYEIIAYRTPENRGEPRKINSSSIKEMNQKTAPLTFNNIDPETDRILITPRGADPILYGIRGETPEAVKQAHQTVVSEEIVERWVIFRTNHGTDAHLKKIKAINEVQPFQPVIARGVVAEKPYIVPRRHVIFSIHDETAKIDCAAYEPTGALRKNAKKLVVGDFVQVYGGVRPASSEHPLTVNLEKIRILELASKTIFRNPLCPKCGRRMKSMGIEKGFRCKRCGFRSSEMEKISVQETRGVEKRLYVTSPRSQRHLTKPLCRYGKEKADAPKTLIDGWHGP
ncbi:MAG: tRNA(Ile)(2)-agmatinylcytidine synthase [Thermoproteota archaeon]|nr:tRNA(Ile)(2)-agmatinylcytidine synthase [Thermoproteota archaeon]